MREIAAPIISEAVAQLCIDANYHLGEDVLTALKEGLAKEESPTGRAILEQIIENAGIARQGEFPMCQDTGFAIFFVELGQEVIITGKTLEEAITEGVRKGYGEGFLRKSIVSDPLQRVNTKDNTPPVIWIETKPGKDLKITVAPKGGGSENMSEVAMLTPSDGAEGVKNFVVDKVRRAGSNPCPPIVVGVGIGGTFEKVAWLAKKSLLRPVGDRHPDPFYAAMELELLDRINKLGIGPQGLGGRVTALDVHVEVFPCHIASLPASVNIQCHAARHKSIVI
ncbi:MAG TPA: fumarate hydratase [bacterium]|nr:fumarate hydratase [bacterium]HQG45633.1 fumarate hydratase [bacterium]HQI47302.1 fumarate hydratase [bacterium]HQJ63789.1 fumarate hydratase [bacterium]